MCVHVPPTLPASLYHRPVNGSPLAVVFSWSCGCVQLWLCCVWLLLLCCSPTPRTDPNHHVFFCSKFVLVRIFRPRFLFSFRSRVRLGTTGLDGPWIDWTDRPSLSLVSHPRPSRYTASILRSCRAQTHPCVQTHLGVLGLAGVFEFAMDHVVVCFLVSFVASYRMFVCFLDFATCFATATTWKVGDVYHQVHVDKVPRPWKGKCMNCPTNTGWDWFNAIQKTC